ncbi:Zinc finger CW-type PWWP domain protein 2 homolog [Lemmus lemmus]
MDLALKSSEFVDRVWVQCENESCLKWRLLSPEAAARVERSEPWYCFMNADSSYSSCSVSEEDFPTESCFLESGYKIVYSQLPLGSLVLVKLKNWPSWPGILCPDPYRGKYVAYDQDGNVDKYHIEFLGDPHSTAWISATFVGHFSLSLQTQVSKNNTEKKKPKVRKRKRIAALRCSVENVCSDEALSKENMDATWIYYIDDFMHFGASEPKAATGSICVAEGKTEMPQRFQDPKGPWITDTLLSEKRMRTCGLPSDWYGLLEQDLLKGRRDEHPQKITSLNC